MRIWIGLAALCLILTACGNPKPPVGKWEGALDHSDVMVVARVEILRDGKVKVSAPNLVGFPVGDENQIGFFRKRLSEELAADWDDVIPREFDFDGKTFRKPGGLAPQMEWDTGPGRLTLVVYLGKDPARRIPMREVSTFSDDPFERH